MKKVLSVILTVLVLITIGSFSLLASAAGVEGMAVY